MKLRSALLTVLFLTICHSVKAQVIDTLIDVGTSKLHFKVIKGNGSMILFESGGGLTLAQWDSLIVPVKKATGATIITYDRQGFGGSSIDTANYSILNEVKGLESGLKKLGYFDKPMLIVAHSVGAFYARVYASRHVNLVKGIVMLDPRIPSSGDMIFAKTVNSSLDRAELKKEDLGLFYLLTNMEQSIEVVSAAELKPALPIRIIMAETGPFDSASDNERFKSDQRAFVKEGTNRSLFYAKGSSHNIPQDQPGLVIDEVAGFYKKYIR